jgi:hypothetical protein
MLLFALLVCLSYGSAGSDGVLSLENRSVRVRLLRGRGACREEWFARSSGIWHMVAVSGSRSRKALVLGSAAGMVDVPMAHARLLGKGNAARLELRGTCLGARCVETIRLLPDSPFAHVTVILTTDIPLRASALLSTYSFAPDGKDYARYAPVDFVFTPQLRPLPDEVIADHVFRSPAFILQEGSVAAAMIPDLESIDGRGRALPSGGDLQLTAEGRPFISFGLMNWKRRPEHVFYAHADTMLSRVGPGALTYSFYLYLSASAPPREAYRDIVRFEWATEGHRYLTEGPSPQSAPFSEYIHKAWYQFLPRVALDTVYRGIPVTLLRQGRLSWSNHLPPAADDDCWFNVWFNSLRTAYGMYMEGRATGDTLLAGRATRVLNLALLAPRTGGLAPTIFYIDSAGGHWVADQAWGGIEGGRLLPMFHNCWTATWMLAWADLVPSRRGEILDFVSGIARFLIGHQRKSGVIPSWYDPQSGEPSPVLGDENAETAGAALFLSRYARSTGDSASGRAAEKAMSYIFTSVVPERKWFDFETFFSCSAKPVTFFDSVTGQYPQNTLSIWMASEACASLYALTGKREYVDRGSAILDYLCLYQQVWSPRWLSRELFGGFGVQNTDAEWSDARQGYFAVTLTEYYSLTGNREYFERGVAALRAMFSLFESGGSPRTAENYGHSGGDDPSGVTGLHWGTGSSVVSIHLITALYGDAYVNVRDCWGAGIDGCSISAVDTTGGDIRFALRDMVGMHRTVRVKFGFTDGRIYSVTVNGRTLGRFTGSELERGIGVTL